jgi:quinol monooxygenase YgiN
MPFAHATPSTRFDHDRTVRDIDTSTADESKLPNNRYKLALIAIENRPTEQSMEHSATMRLKPRSTAMFSRRTAIGAILVACNLSPWTVSSSRSQEQSRQQGDNTMNQYASNKTTIADAVSGGGLLVVAQWEAREGQADKVADILDRFLPEAQSDPGAKLFLIGRNKDKPAEFLFYELFRDEAALKAHQESAYFKTYIAGQALPLLAKRERAQYTLL